MYNNNTMNTPHEISDAFNDYFSNIAPELANKLPSTQTSHNSYLRGDYPNSMVMPIIVNSDTVNAITSFKN